MRSINKILTTLGLLLAAASFNSCAKYLDVSPVDQFLENDVIKNEESIYKTLNGVYLNMAKTELYGANLSMTTMDILAQYYSYTSVNNWYNLATYSYQEANSKQVFNAVWSSSYKSVLNINSFIANVNKSKDVLTPESKSIILGEAYALRAFLHFDLLRIFGPVYSKKPDAKSIPYLSSVTEEIQPLLPASAVLDSIISDLNKAEGMLEKDTIRTGGVVKLGDSNGSSDFFKLRNRRLNYYAVLGLKSRVLLYKGDRKEAYSVAKRVIDEGQKWFPWTNPNLTLPGNPNPDRVFSSEVIFGLKNYDMYEVQRNDFSMHLSSDKILVPFEGRLNSIYETNLNDYRFRINWTSGIAAGKAFKTFIKYEDVIDKTQNWRNFQPLLRLSELYFILAECADNPTESLNYLNVVRKNRGLSELGTIVNVAEQIENEYCRELWGEGQLFYYYKRKAKDKIPGGNKDQFINMTDEKYIIPLPESETRNR